MSVNCLCLALPVWCSFFLINEWMKGVSNSSKCVGTPRDPRSWQYIHIFAAVLIFSTFCLHCRHCLNETIDKVAAVFCSISWCFLPLLSYFLLGSATPGRPGLQGRHSSSWGWLGIVRAKEPDPFGNCMSPCVHLSLAYILCKVRRARAHAQILWAREKLLQTRYTSQSVVCMYV